MMILFRVLKCSWVYDILLGLLMGFCHLAWQQLIDLLLVNARSCIKSLTRLKASCLSSFNQSARFVAITVFDSLLMSTKCFFSLMQGFLQLIYYNLFIISHLSSVFSCSHSSLWCLPNAR